MKDLIHMMPWSC